MLPELLLIVHAGAIDGARSIGRSIHDAEDIAQTVVLRLIQKGTEIKASTARNLGYTAGRRRRELGGHREPMQSLGERIWKL